MVQESYADHLGREEHRKDVLRADELLGLAALLDTNVDEVAPQGAVPPLAHWLYFKSWAPQSELGADGHPRRGGFLPPIELPRRMFAGARLEFLDQLNIEDVVERRSVIQAITPKIGASGQLVFVTVQHRIFGPRGLAIIEEQDIVYREAAPEQPTSVPDAATHVIPEGHYKKRISPDPVMLFRFSALTANGHRIHYDRPYATGEEGYPGLVVHGPLQAMLLVDAARLMGLPARAARLSFQARRPLFDTAAFWCVGSRVDGGAELSTRDLAGNVCAIVKLDAAT